MRENVVERFRFGAGPLAAGPVSDMPTRRDGGHKDAPGRILRDESAMAWGETMARRNLGKGWADGIAAAANALAVTGLGVFSPSLASQLPGGPERYVDPVDLGIAFVPGAALARGARLASRPIRALAHGVQGPAARSSTGQIAERGADLLMPAGPAARKAGKELKRQQEIVGEVVAAPVEVLEKTARKLRNHEQVALQLVIEGTTPAQRIAYHEALREAATTSLERRLHGIHIRLLERAKPLVRVANDGKTLGLTGKARQSVHDGLELMLETGVQREEILRRLRQISDETISGRRAKPGRRVRGEDPEPNLLDLTWENVERDVPVGKLEARAAELDRRLDGIVRHLEESLGPQGSSAAFDQRLRNMAAGRVRGRRAGPRPTVSEERTGAAYKVLDDLMQLETEHPGLRSIQDMIRERDELARLIESHRATPDPFGLNPAPEPLPLPRETVRMPGPRTVEDAFDPLGYVHHARGIPGATTTMPVRRLRTTIGGMVGGRRRAITMLTRDPYARKEWAAKLIESGRLRTDAANVTAEVVHTALRLDAIDRMRKELLARAVTKDEALAAVAGSDDIAREFGRRFQAIKVDPRKGMSDELRQTFEALDANAALDTKALARGGDDLAERLRKEVFPEAVSLDDPNVLWVDTNLVKGAFYQEALRVGSRLQADSFAGTLGFAPLKAAGELWQVANDAMRIAFFYANPSYYVLNFVGNVALDVMQQGVFLPRNMGRAWKWARDLDQVDTHTWDRMAGNGQVLGVLRGESVAGPLMNPLSRAAHVLVDLWPRRLAVVHEAARAGVKTPGQFTDLLAAVRAGDKAAQQKAAHIAQRSRDALIDYGRLSPFERDIVTKLIFIYPFVKGSTRYSMRFPLEHPAQAALVATAGYLQQQARGDLPEGPWYTQSLIEIPEQIPEEVPLIGGAELPFAGKVTDLNTLLPFGVPPELAQAAYATATGHVPGHEGLMGQLLPTVQAGARAITGRGEYGQQLEGGVFQRFGQQLYEQIPLRRRLEALGLTEEERAGKLYPRDTRDIIGQFIGGRAAPAPVNWDVAKEIAQSPDERAQEDLEAELADARQLLTPGEVRQVERALDLKAEMDAALEDLDGKAKARAEAAGKVYLKYFPGDRQQFQARMRDAQIDKDYEDLLADMRRPLYGDLLRRWTEVRNDMLERRERAQAQVPVG